MCNTFFYMIFLMYFSISAFVQAYFYIIETYLLEAFEFGHRGHYGKTLPPLIHE